MSVARVHRQVHGYRRGHQLLSSSIRLEGHDQDVVDRLSDLAGSLPPGQEFEPYLTAYAVPSGEYYVVARTFQDLNTPRAGCVVTSSLLVPMRSWQEMEGWAGVLADLVRPAPGYCAVESEVSSERTPPPARVGDGRVVQLVDAVFREERSVVFFECEEAEAIAVRLLWALWPAARRRFSLCTFAFGPRTLDSGFFDLVFAPSQARARFVGFGLHQIGGSGRDSTVGADELSWAEPVAHRIFKSDDPSLVRLDTLGMLADPELSDITLVRLVALWNKLESRAATIPTAVLGMLDILRSQQGRLQTLPQTGFGRTVLASIQHAATRLPVKQAWEFLFALEAKVRGLAIGDTPSAVGAPSVVPEGIEAWSRTLACRDARGALAGLSGNATRQAQSSRVVKGLADGLAEAQDLSNLAEAVADLSAGDVAQLMGASVPFAHAVAEAMNAEPTSWVDVFLRSLRAGDEGAKDRMRVEVLRVIEDQVVDQTVPPMLDGLTGGRLEKLAVDVVARRESVSPSLNRAVGDAARRSGDIVAVRDAVLKSQRLTAADQFVLGTLEMSSADVDWLTGHVNDKGRANRLLRGLLGQVGQPELEALLARDQQVTNQVLALLGAQVEASAGDIARVLTVDVVKDLKAINLGFNAMRSLSGDPERRSLGEWLLRTGLSEAPPDDDRVSMYVAEFGSRFTATELVQLATADRLPKQRVSANVVALAAAPPSVRQGVLTEVGELSSRLMKRSPSHLGSEGFAAWASLIRDAAQRAPGKEAVCVASSVLRFAFRLRRIPVSTLVVECFPIVYAEVPKPRAPKNRARSASPSASLLPFWIAGVPTTDSRTRLIDELVRTFMDSTWPEADLIVAAMRAGVGKKVVRSVRKRWRGDRYIDRIRRDAKRLQQDVRAEVRTCLRAAR